MNKPQSGRRDSRLRGARRSLVELAISAASNAGVETPSAAQPAPIAKDAAMMRRDKPSAAPKQRRKKRIHEPVTQTKDVDANTLPAAKKASAAENLPTAVAVLPPQHGLELGKVIVVPRSDKTIAAVTITAVYRANVFASIDAHVKAAFDYAEQLAHVKSLTEFAEVSTSHACRNMERIVIQAAELGLLAVSNFQRMTTALTGKEADLQTVQHRTFVDHYGLDGSRR